jgi:hypothetical protein
MLTLGKIPVPLSMTEKKEHLDQKLELLLFVKVGQVGRNSRTTSMMLNTIMMTTVATAM